jgi:hypothetical protein
LRNTGYLDAALGALTGNQANILDQIEDDIGATFGEDDFDTLSDPLKFLKTNGTEITKSELETLAQQYTGKAGRNWIALFLSLAFAVSN